MISGYRARLRQNRGRGRAAARGAAGTLGAYWRTTKNTNRTNKFRVENRPVQQPVVDRAPLHSIYNSRTTYKAKRPNKRRLRFAKKRTFAWRKEAAKVENPQFGLGYNGFANVSTSNTQNYFSIDFLNSNDLAAMFNAQLALPQPAVLQRDYQLYIKSYRIEFTLRNYGTTTCFLKIYKCVPRKDISTVEIPAGGGNGNTLVGFFDQIAGTAATTGIDVIQDPATDPLFSTSDPGMTPFQNTRFTRAFKIVEIKKVMLAPSDYHQWEGTLRKPIYINYERFNDTTYCRGVSECYLISQYGLFDGTTTYPSTSIFMDWTVNSCSKVLKVNTSSMARVLKA